MKLPLAAVPASTRKVGVAGNGPPVRETVMVKSLSSARGDAGPPVIAIGLGMLLVRLSALP